jgi:hypothetical protein
MKFPRLDPRIVMPLDGNRNVLFLWMPKCAGCSIRDGLWYCYGDHFSAYNNQYEDLVFNTSLRCATFYHSHVPSLIEAGWLPQSWVDNAFSFAFVRNSWARMVSLFFYLKKMQYHLLPPTFEEFIKCVVSGSYPGPGYKNLLGYYQANSVLAWLRPGGVWMVDHICRFENLNDEWMTLRYLLGVPLQPLPTVNTTQHRPYQYYYNQETRGLVGRHFAEEIDVFDFQFEE